MYEDFYSLSGMPFQLTPDSRFYFGSQEHRKAMAFLEFGIAQREGFVVITGDVGSGKTTLVEYLLANLDQSQHVAGRVVTTQLNGYDILRMIAAAFGIACEGADKTGLVSRLTELFTMLRAQDKHPLVIVDEAQSLTTEAIEELRMLSNLTSGTRALFQGILLGQPEFRITLTGSNLTQFRQRIVASCHLRALSSEDTRKYIEHRLTRVGWAQDPCFSDDAFEEIYRRAEGIPRRINTLCSRLLLYGYLDERHTLDAESVARVAEELASEIRALASDLVPQTSDAPAIWDTTSNISGEELWSRLARIERATERHDRLINHVLDLALKYLPSQGAK